jgi:predicted unusual protein kinase regulating ubiquinone biosynthesis (AarF/ABC1/UbiB family)
LDFFDCPQWSSTHREVCESLTQNSHAWLLSLFHHAKQWDFRLQASLRSLQQSQWWPRGWAKQDSQHTADHDLVNKFVSSSLRRKVFSQASELLEGFLQWTAQQSQFAVTPSLVVMVKHVEVVYLLSMTVLLLILLTIRRRLVGQQQPH